MLVVPVVRTVPDATTSHSSASVRCCTVALVSVTSYGPVVIIVPTGTRVSRSVRWRNPPSSATTATASTRTPATTAVTTRPRRSRSRASSSCSPASCSPASGAWGTVTAVSLGTSGVRRGGS